MQRRLERTADEGSWGVRRALQTGAWVLALGAAAVLGAGCGDDAVPGGEGDAADVGAAGDGVGVADTAGPDADSSSDVGGGPDAVGPGADVVDVWGDAADSVGDAEGDGPAGPQVCPPGIAGCVDEQQLVCNEDGTAFVLEDCPEGERCFDGLCVVCVTDEDCDDFEVCAFGTCVVPPLSLADEALPPAFAGNEYAAQLEVQGGKPPYTFSKQGGIFPQGISMDAFGAISGLTQLTGTFPLILRVDDAAGDTATAPLELEVLDSGLTITTPTPLPTATDGESYSVTFEAGGGEEPYFWGLAGGDIPPGLAMDPFGTLTGVPSGGSATYAFDVKVFDNATPPATTTKTVKLPVSIAPLEIIGGTTTIDLFLVTVTVLPLIIVVDGIPIPYSAQLDAAGGQKPYAWTEVDLPDAVAGLIPQAGVPQGLTLAADGTLSGAVTDPSLAISIDLFGVPLTGFFFSAEVADDQPVPDTETGLYLIPTVPIGG